MANNLLKKLGENQFVKVCGAFDVMSAKLAEMNGFDKKSSLNVHY